MPPRTLLTAGAVKLRGHTDEVACVAWQPGDELLATGSQDGTVRLWDLRRPGTPVVVVEMGGRVNCLSWTGDGRLLGIGGRFGEAAVWSRAGGNVVGLEGHTAMIVVIQFNGSGSLVVTTSEDRTYRVWKAETGTCQQVVTTADPGALDGAICLAWRDEKEFFLGEGATILRCKVAEDKPVGVLTGHTNWVTSLAWDPRGGILASGSIDQTVRTWRPDAASPAWAILASHDGGVWEVVWRPGQPGILASFSGDVQKVKIWDASEQNCLHTLACAPGSEYTVGMSGAGYISFSADGQQLAAGGQEARVWRAETGDLALVSQVAADTVDYSPKGYSLAAASLGDTVVRVFGLDIRLKALAAQTVAACIRDNDREGEEDGKGEEAGEKEEPRPPESSRSCAYIQRLHCQPKALNKQPVVCLFVDLFPWYMGRISTILSHSSVFRTFLSK